MPSKDDFIKNALSYEGTKFQHQGRLPHVGLDCIGLVVTAAKNAGYDIQDDISYDRRPDGEKLQRALREYCDKIPFKANHDYEAGDILLFAFDMRPQHVGIYLGNQTMIHAYMLAKKTVICRLDDVWKNRLRGIFRIKEQ